MSEVRKFSEEKQAVSEEENHLLAAKIQEATEKAAEIKNNYEDMSARLMSHINKINEKVCELVTEYECPENFVSTQQGGDSPNQLLQEASAEQLYNMGKIQMLKEKLERLNL